MKTLELLNKRISINTEAISNGLLNIHNQDKDIALRLKFGMLDARIIENSEKQIAVKIMDQFDKTDQDLFKSRILDFIKEVNNEISKGIYRNTKLAV